MLPGGHGRVGAEVSLCPSAEPSVEFRRGQCDVWSNAYAALVEDHGYAVARAREGAQPVPLKRPRPREKLPVVLNAEHRLRLGRFTVSRQNDESLPTERNVQVLVSAPGPGDLRWAWQAPQNRTKLEPRAACAPVRDVVDVVVTWICLLYTSPSPRDS